MASTIHNNKMVRIGIDIGSTTAKMVAIGEDGEVLFSKYGRHNAKAREVVAGMLNDMLQSLGDTDASVRITGSVGMGMAEQFGIPFVQEVVAATKTIQKLHGDVRTMIDIGGEDAKIVFMENGKAHDLRMNGNCAGGTGAFIDQMAVILNVGVEELNELAQKSTQTYPIASRCGVFCKTDIQNLIAKNVSRDDIAASIFHAVAVQTVVTLAHGCDIKAPVMFCGGPLTFIPALRKAFAEYLHLDESQMVMPENGALIPAIGTALSCTDADETKKLSEIASMVGTSTATEKKLRSSLQPIFSSKEEYGEWKRRISRHAIEKTPLKAGRQRVFLGIDSGSTTTKIVVTDEEHRLLYSHYRVNGGNPIKAVEEGLVELKNECLKCNAELEIVGSCSTGYGEDLIKTAFMLNGGIVETMAHYMAASHLDEKVSFILDIGGQDMKAMFVNNGVIDRIEINEACSSGCGSFIETFAKTLGYSVGDFAVAACRSTSPCDLGTRCTVFMNSKVKQVLREGATVEDIAAGLAYSVIKNCLYKVLKLKDTAALGENIVVQGGTMRNDAVVRTLEILTGANVTRCDVPELMGAYGCALYASEHVSDAVSLDHIISKAAYTIRLLHCKGCDNQCLVSCYQFANGKKYYSGNRCERVFTNGDSIEKGANIYRFKCKSVFGGDTKDMDKPLLNIGIPRCLNMYENFPFWQTLLTECGMKVTLSEVSNFAHYERCARMVMSDNICFPAKLVHSHIENLMSQGVDRIFMPFVIFEKQDSGQNSFNCPVVTGYSEVIKSVQGNGTPIDSPAISFKDRRLLFAECWKYLKGLGVKKAVTEEAFAKAERRQADYAHSLTEENKKVYEESQKGGRFVVLLAGRPYHSDPLIQHKVSELIAGMGIDVITDDIVRDSDIEFADSHFLAQWTYPNRILKAARWCAMQGDNVQMIQLTSFGCGPDAFLVDEVRDMLLRHGKTLTLLKLDDINNVGSMKLRVRSLVESLKISHERNCANRRTIEFQTTPIYDDAFRNKKIISPYFTPFLSPLIPAVMKIAGYDVDTLPMGDSESGDWGLKYANNEVCYPATLIVGDIIKAFKSGKYNPDETVVAMTQTGGQCRASNYIALIKKALVDAGYKNTPVVSLTFGDSIKNDQPAFKVNWLKILPTALRTILYSDCISKFFYATLVREKRKGLAAELKEKYIDKAKAAILEKRSKALYAILGDAAYEFDQACRDADCPQVGVVGEIFLKFNPFAHRHVTDWLSDKGIEVVPSVLTDFFMQAFVNSKAWDESDVEKLSYPKFVYNFCYKLIRRQIEKMNSIASAFRYFIPFNDIFDEAEEAKNVVTLNAQFGEGWLLPAEVMSYARQGIYNVVSLQPFGCIANHIISKGIEKRIKTLIPEMNMLSLDFDSGVSDVNITNRMLLFIDNLKVQAAYQTK